MAIQAVGNMMPFGGIANPVQNAGAFAVVALAFNAFANMQMAAGAVAAPKVKVTGATPNPLEKEICEKLCAPLPGEKEDGPEQVCNEVCTKGGVVTRTTKWIKGKAEWMPYVEPVFEPVGHVAECYGVCGKILDSAKAISGKFFTDWASKGFAYASGKAAIKSACVIPSQVGGAFGQGGASAGYAGCMACCNGLYWTGILQ